jgi:hypothetical protein
MLSYGVDGNVIVMKAAKTVIAHFKVFPYFLGGTQ